MTYFMDVNDVVTLMGVSKTSAYNIIKVLNQELQEKGYLVVAGKVPKEYLVKRYYLTGTD